MTRIAAIGGALLGALSRIEETTSGFSAGISANATWLAVAFAAGALQRGSQLARGALGGALALVAANGAYYAWIALLEPAVDLARVAGPPLRWFALGAAGGAVFGCAGRLWATARGPARVLGVLPLAGVLIADGAPALLGGSPADAAGLAIGAALPVLAARSARERALGLALSAAVVGAALTGRLEALLP